MDQFCLDSNVLIEAARRYYAFDIVPAFWSQMLACSRDNCVNSIDRVRDEVVRGGDDLAKWVENQQDLDFRASDLDEVVAEYRKMIQWAVMNPQFKNSAKDEFASVADGWLIAYAKAKNQILVTQETYKPDVRSRIPIPNVCRQFDVQYVDTFEMLRRLKVQIV